MAETMLYVNEHLHDALWEGHDDPQWIRSFRPGDYLVLTVANGESLVVSGHPAERGTFDFFIAAMGRRDLADDPRFVDVASRLANFDALREIIRDYAATMPDAATFEEQFSKHQLAVGRVRQPGELTDTDWARERHAVVAVDDRGGGTIRVPNVAVALQCVARCRRVGDPEVPGRGQPRAARRTARLRRGATRRTGGLGRAVESPPRRLTPSAP